MNECLTVQLMGSDSDFDRIHKDAQKVLEARPFVICQWLLVLHKVHCLHQNDPELPDFASCSDFLGGCNEAFMATSQHINGAEAVNEEKTIGDDVSGIRTGVMEEEPVTASEAEDELPCAHTHSCVFDDNQDRNSLTSEERRAKRREETEEAMEAIADVCGVDISESVKEWHDSKNPVWKSVREDDPLSEFEELDELLVGAFPQVFLFGRAHGQLGKEAFASKPIKNRFSSKHIRHLLLQHTTAAATCRELLFCLFDCCMRHSFMKNLSAKIRADPGAFAKYADMLWSEEW